MFAPHLHKNPRRSGVRRPGPGHLAWIGARRGRTMGAERGGWSDVTSAHLSAEDTTLWCAQASDAPLQIGGVVVCEGAPLRDATGAIPIARIRSELDGRLGVAPRFRQVLRTVPLGPGLVWVDDPHFDIARHVRLVALPRPGSDEQLREFVARLMEVPLRPDRPLWEFWVVDGLAGDRVALVPRLSHVMGDGTAVLRLVLSLFNGQPRPVDSAPPAPPTPPAPPGRRLPLPVTARAERWRWQAAAVGSVGRAVATPSVASARAMAVARAGRSILRIAPTMPITRPVGARRDFAWVQLSRSGLEEVKQAAGVKLNDVVLAVCSAGVNRYLAGAGIPPDRLRVVVPVSTHGDDPLGEIENRFSIMFVDLVAAGDPLERVRQVHAETTRHKASAQADLGTALLALGGVLPPRLLGWAAPRLLRHQPFANLAVTNLAGPPVPLYLFGARLLEMYPYVTVTGNLGTIFGIVSYADTIGVGITVDADVVPDVGRLAAAVAAAGDEVASAGAATSSRAAAQQ
jgi:diacylglycerol O-acyltransferase / wax synthase